MTDRAPTNPEALAKAVREWLDCQENETASPAECDESDTMLEAALILWGVIGVNEYTESLDNAEGFAVLVTLESGEWFTVDREGNMIAVD